MTFNQKINFQEFITDKEIEIKNVVQKNEAKTPTKFEANKNSFSVDSELKNSEKSPKNDELKFFGVSEYYIKEISQELISKYGNYFSKTFDQKKLDIPSSDFMAKHKINPMIRTKMVNWMLEVFHSFKSNEETIFCAVKLMDKYIWKSKNVLKSEDIHLIGIVCMYIASKTYDVSPIQMNILIHLVGHDLFDQKTIKKMEKKVIKTINYEVFNPTTYEFIEFLLYDFYTNHKDAIVGLKLKKMLDILENCSIFLGKMCNHFEKYSTISPIHLSVTCLIIAFDMMKDNCKSLTEEKQKFFKDWLLFLYRNIAKTEEIKTEIENIYKSIEITYTEFEKKNLQNLMKFHELYFE